MLDDHAHVMQVKLCKANTRGVTATTSTGEALPMAASMGEQAEEGTSGVPVAGVAWPVMSSTS